MNCSEFRALIFEFLGRELPAEKQADFVRHGDVCAACRIEMDRWRELETQLRAGWPDDEPLPLPIIVPRRPTVNWLDLAWLWFARASAMVVVFSLVALVLLRPAVHGDRAGVSLAFRGAAPAAALPQGGALDQAQIQAWLQAAVDRAVADRTAPANAPGGWPTAESGRWNRVVSQLRLSQESQLYLWRQVQEQQAELQSLWRASAARVEPAVERQPQVQ